MNKNHRALAGIAAGIALVLVGAAAVLQTGYSINYTDSVPIGLWRVVDRQPGRSDFVVFCPADTPLFHDFKARGYMSWLGPCPGGLEKLIKPIVGMPGDTVTVAPGGVSVNGTFLPGTQPQTQDSKGRPLVPLLGTFVVGDGDLWVVSNHSPLAIDGRYFGSIPATSVRGVALPVWVGR